MERSVTLIRVRTNGRAAPELEDCSARILRIVESFGGTSEGLWRLGGTGCELVSAATYPDREAVRRARTAIEALGLVTVEGYPTAELGDCLQTVAA